VSLASHPLTRRFGLLGLKISLSQAAAKSNLALKQKNTRRNDQSNRDFIRHLFDE
jgi:hypothetical protein